MVSSAQPDLCWHNLNLTMPVMGGQHLYRLIQRYDNELAKKCIFITGAIFNSELQEFIAATGNPSLNKPFSLQAAQKLIAE